MLGCMAVDEIGLCETRLLLQCVCAGLPAARDDLRDGKSSTCVADRWGEHAFERELAEALVEFGPAIDAAGYGHAKRAAAGDEFQVAVLEFFEGESARAAAAGIEAVEFFCVGVPYDREQVAAESAAHRLGHAEDGIGGDGGVDGVAAGLQDLDGRLSGERLTRGRH